MQKKSIIIGLFLLIAFFIPRYILKSSLNLNHQHLTAAELKAAIDGGGDSIIVINVLSSKAYQDCHIPSSVNIAFGDLAESDFVAAVRQYKSRDKIIIYCASEQFSASSAACKLLAKSGMKNVYEYSGGMKEWYNLAGYESVGLCELSYLGL